ncbi:MAG: hypothetical protein ACYTJ0_16680, partial [Planctomycetota bacterium]
MRVTFGLELDGGSWPGPLGDGRAAAAGEPWVGPLGFLDILETQLGLGGPPVSAAMRAVSLVPAVRAAPGFWSRSAAVDPIGAAAELLRWRDELVLHGWDGEPLDGAPRLAQLAAITATASPGPADRLRACADACSGGGAAADLDVEQVTVVGRTVDELPAAWRRMLEAMQRGGTVVETARVPVAAAAVRPADLACCLDDGFDPRGDGSLQLLRPVGRLTAAEQVAAWIARHVARAADDVPDGAAPILIVGGDEALDAALQRQGLPALGLAGASAADNGLLQVLPLVLEMGWSPPDPKRALALLELPVAPVPFGTVGWRLRRALTEWPAVDSDDWRAALAEGLAAIEDDPYRAAVAERIGRIFAPAAAIDDDRAADEIEQRVRLVAKWLQGRIAREDAPTAAIAAALAQCAAFTRLREASGESSLSRRRLVQLLRAATDEASLAPALPAQAGIARVAAPGAVAGPVACVVWWGFIASAPDAVPRRPLPLVPDEIAALGAVGVVPPDRGREAQIASRLWRRPFELARRAVLLVSPTVGDDDRQTSPHPVWDEITAGLDDVQVDRLQRAEPSDVPRTRPLPALALPTPQATWTLAADARVRWDARELS